MTDQGLTNEAAAAACKDGNPITKVRRSFESRTRDLSITHESLRSFPFSFITQTTPGQQELVIYPPFCLLLN